MTGPATRAPGAPTAPRPVTFFFPYYEISGVPVVFERLSRQLASRLGVPAAVIDYPDGYQARALAGDSGVRIVPFTDGVPCAVERETILVMQAILPAAFHCELEPHPETRLFFWTLHPLNLVQTLVPLPWVRDFQTRHPGLNRLVLDTVMRGHRDVMRELVRRMHRAGALAFMDGTTLTSTAARLGLKLEDPLFLPVPADTTVPRRRLGPRASRSGPLEFGWLGRLADFKIHILSYLMRRLSAYARHAATPMAMHVVGDGPEADRIRALDVTHEHFSVRFPGVLTGPALDAYLDRHVDVLAAMGASALEGARLGIPTVLLDVAYGPLRGDYKFRWLFEADRYSLAEIVGRHSFEPGNRSLERIIGMVEGADRSLSDRTYNYCRRHHALDAVASRFLQAVQASRFRWADLPPGVMRKTLIRRTYERVRAWSRRKAGRP